MVIGKVGDVKSSTKHSSLFQSSKSQVLADDDGKVASVRVDFCTETYEEIIQLFTNAGDWILFPKFLSGKLYTVNVDSTCSQVCY